MVVVQPLSLVRLFATSWTATHQASLSFTISRSLLRLRFNELMMPFNHLVICHCLLFLPSIFPISRVFSNELARHIRWPKYWNFSFSFSPSNEYSGLISFSISSIDRQVPYQLNHPSLGARLLGWLLGKESTCQHRRLRRRGSDPWVRKIPWKSSRSSILA